MVNSLSGPEVVDGQEIGKRVIEQGLVAVERVG